MSAYLEAVLKKQSKKLNKVKKEYIEIKKIVKREVTRNRSQLITVWDLKNR